MKVVQDPAVLEEGAALEVSADPRPLLAAGATELAAPPTTARKGGPSLSRRASLNSIAALLDFGARSIVEFLINPLLVSRLGSAIYGAWRLLLQLTGYLWAASGRSAPALTAVIANRQHSTDHEEKRRLLASAMVTWLIFLPVLVVAGGAAAWFAPSYLNVPSPSVGVVRLAALLLVGDAIVLALVTLPRSALQGENLGYKRMGASALVLLAQGGLMALAAWTGGGIVAVAAAYAAGTILTGLLFWRVARRHVAWFGLARPSRAHVRWFLGLNWWFTIWKVVAELMVAGDVLVVALFAPLDVVAVYALTRFVSEALGNLLTTPLQGVAPGLGGIIGARDHDRAIRARNEFLAFNWLVVTVVGTGIVLWNGSFLHLWVGSRYYSGLLTTLLVVLLAVQLVFIRSDAYVIDLTLSVRKKVLLGVLSVASSFALASFFMGPLELGPAGAAAGFLLGRSIMTIAYPWLVGHAIGHPLSAQVRGALRPILTTGLLFAAAAVLAPAAHVDGWLGLITFVMGTVVVSGAVAVVAGLTPIQRRSLRTRLSRIAVRSRRGSAA